MDEEHVLDIEGSVTSRASGIRDPGLLESAVAMPRATGGGEFVHDGLFTMAAAYAFHVAQNQPFLDGNKRTGLLAAVVFLDLNGVGTPVPATLLVRALVVFGMILGVVSLASLFAVGGAVARLGPRPRRAGARGLAREGQGVAPPRHRRACATGRGRPDPRGMSTSDLRSVALPSGDRIPALGLGTWHMGEDPSDLRSELAALARGLDLGLTLVDTAEMYGDGGAEELVGRAIAGRRDGVLPSNASRAGTVRACEASLRRLRTDRIDLYLLHWRGPHPLRETVEAFRELREAGKIRLWGVSNLDVDDLEELSAVPGGGELQTDQVLYNLTRRGTELDLQPWCRRRRIPIMAYSPIEQGRLLGEQALRVVAARLGATPAQVALAWVLRGDGVVAIPKAATVAHVDENRAALDLRLSDQDLADLEAAFPAPAEPRPLEML